MNHLSLFSGIGGLDLAAEWAGFRTVAFVERDPYCQRVLAKRWPGVPCFDDVRRVVAHADGGLCLESVGPVQAGRAPSGGGGEVSAYTQNNGPCGGKDIAGDGGGRTTAGQQGGDADL